LTGTDEVGATCTDSLTFLVGTPPEVIITLPLPGAEESESAIVPFEAMVDDDTTPPEALDIVWESDIDGVIDETAADSSGFVSWDTESLSVGDHLITVTVTDSDGFSTVETVELRIDGAPSAPAVDIEPSDPADEDDLVAAIITDSVDPEGDPVSYTWAWTVNGASAPYTGDTVPASATTRGEVWAVSVTPNDGYGDGAAGTASVNIANTAPVLASLTLSPDPAVEGDVLACTEGSTSDADSDIVTTTTTWWVDGIQVAASGDTLGDTWWASGDTVYCEATPNDGYVDGATLRSNTVTIGNTAPLATAADISPDPAYADDALVCGLSGYFDADGDPDLSTYEWTVNGAVVGTSDTLAAGFIGGDLVVCAVTPFDGLTAGATVSASLTVSNTPPVLASAALTPTSAGSTDTLTCTPGATSDLDGTSTFSYGYGWTVNGAALGATTSTLSPSDFDSGDSVRCYVTPNDGVDDGAAVASNAVTISNAAPVVSAAAISPSAPDTDDTLTASATAADADGDTITLSYAWSVNGLGVAATGSTLAGSWFSKGDSVSVSVTPSDAFGAGAAFASSAVTVVNSAPSLTGAAISPSSATVSDPLSCAGTGYSDLDGDSDLSTYVWSIGGVTVGTGSALSAGYAEGDVVTCTVTPNDGAAAGAPQSTAVTIGGSAPVLSGVTLTPSTAYEADTLTCTPGATTDPDGTTSFTYTTAWYVGGSLIAPTSTTLTGASFSRGDAVFCRVTPSDGTSFGAAVASGSVTISNTAPGMASVSLSPATVYTNDTLTATVSASDADSDTLSYTYLWKVNGSTVAATGSTLSGVSWFVRGDSVTVTVTPSDGTVSGAAMTSSAKTVSNSAPTATTAVILPDPATTSDALTCALTDYADVDGDSAATTYVWRVNGTSVGTGASLSTGYRGGDVVSCTATPNDGTTAGAAVSDSLTITNTAPVLAGASLTPTTATEASTLTCTPGATTDADGTTAFTYAYAWRVNGSTVAATASTLTSSYFSSGDSVACLVTPHDGTSLGAAVLSNTVTIANTAPVMVAVSLSPSTAYTNDTLTALASASDAEGDTVAFTYVWKVNGSTVAATGATLSGATWFNKGDSVTVTATPTDGVDSGAAMTSSARTISNSAPSATAATITPDPATATDTLSCALVGYSDADGDAAATTYVWKVGSTTVGTGSTLSTGFTAGSTVTCTATPNDGSTTGAAVSDSLTVGNTAPVLTSVSLSPTTAYEANTLTCTPGTTTDADGTTSFTYTYAWRVNGSAVAATSSTLTGSSFSKGDTVYCLATPSDGTDSGAAVASNTVTISNTAPVLSSVTLTPSTPTLSSTLTCTPGTTTDADGTSSFTYTYAWSVNGSTIAPTTSTLTSASFSIGQSVSCSATPNDGTSAGAAVASNTVTISNTAPVLSSVSLTPTTAYEANTLTCTPGSTTDADGTTSFTYTYAWTVNGASIAPTTSTLTGTYFSVGQAVVCLATPNDGTSSGLAVASNTVTISNTAPVLSSVTLTPTTAYEASTLTCTPGSTTDADGTTSFTYTYAWTVNGAAIAPTSSTLSGTYFSVGQAVVCAVTASDGTTAGSATASNTVTISNSAPVLSSVTLSPTTAYEADTLTCTPGATTDADGTTSFTYSYVWVVNGSTIAPTSSTLSGTYFSVGQSVYCRATPSDGTSAGASASSNTVTISNTPPVLASVSVSPSTAYESSTLTCTPGTTTDADGTTSFTYSYAWYVNASLIAPTTSTLTGTYFSKGNTVYCKATPNDGTSAGSAATASSVTISNTAPVMSSASLTPTTAYESSTLTCSPSASDADGDTVTYSYAWYKNSSLIAATSATLTGSSFSKGDTVYCRVTPTDGTTAGSASSSSTVTISNTAPTAPVIAIDPTSPEASVDDLFCDLNTASTDADGDTITYTFTWTKNGTAVASSVPYNSLYIDDAVYSTSLTSGEVWICKVTASDGTASSSTVSSSSVTVLSASYTIGYYTVFTTPGTGSAAGGYSLGHTITVSSTVSLYQLGERLRLADSDSIRLALYTNSGGQPGTLVAYTALTSLSSYAAGSAVDLDVVGGPITVTAGTYWLMHNLSGTAYMGYTTTGASGNTIYYNALSSSSAFPTSWGSGSTYTGQFMNTYMVVR
jgi:hypothetical protein